jgi:hypothetical protein
MFGTEEEADEEIDHQAADDDDREGALRVRPDVVRQGGREQAERRHEHREDDRAQTQHRALDDGILEVHATGTQLVDVLHHDHADLHAHAEEGEEPEA